MNPDTKLLLPYIQIIFYLGEIHPFNDEGATEDV